MENIDPRKKILFLVTQSEMGGAQRYVYEVATHLDYQKYEVLVAAGEGDQSLNLKLKAKSEKQQLKTQKLRYLKRTPWPWQIVLVMGEISNLLKKERPDVLFLCSTTAGLLGSIAVSLYKIQNAYCSHTAKYKIRVIYRIGGWAFRDPRPALLNWLILLAEKITAPLKDIIIVNSEEDLQLALKYKVCSPEKIVKIYNGIDINSLDFLPREEARQKLSISTGSVPVLGTVANFYKTKGLEYLIEAFRLLRSDLQRRSDLLVFIGDGKERPKLEALIKKYGLENMVFLAGKIPDAYKYLKAFDVFVLPSLKEGFPWIILEAMAAEVPIVAARVGAVPEIIEDGKEGFLVEPKNSQALAEKTTSLIGDAGLSQKFVRQAKEKLKEFSLQTMIQKTESLFL